MRNVQAMIAGTQNRVLQELPEGFDLTIRELKIINQISEGTPENRWYTLICNAFYFGAACGLEYYERNQKQEALLERAISTTREGR